MSLPPSYEVSTCICNHCDWYHLVGEFKCVFTGCGCTGFVIDCGMDEPDEIVLAQAEIVYEKTSVVGDPTEGWAQMDYGEYMLY